MKVAIVGYDIEGRANYEYWSAQGHDITVCDQKSDIEVPAGIDNVLGDGYLNDLDRFDLIVRTAGLSPLKILAANPSVKNKITPQINEFMRVCPTRHVVGVTGTKGKGTTTTLVAKMLEATGKKVFVGGNIGVPPMTFLGQLDAESRVVLELSSFQLIDLQRSPHYAVCLMMAPEHLDWHTDLDEYINAKAQLFSHQDSNDKAIYFANNDLSKQVAEHSPGSKIPYFASPGAYVDGDNIVIDGQNICRTDEVKLLGSHNLQNICAAITTVWRINPDREAIRSVITSFSGLPFRLEMVRELNGVKYYNDSFGTTPETAMVAVQAFEQPKVLILGGSDKGANYDQLAKTISQSNVRQILLIGEQSDRIQAALEAAGISNFQPGGKAMPEIVAKAHGLAQPHDIVLLSTACASFDMFKNYKDRGEQFNQAVRALV